MFGWLKRRRLKEQRMLLYQNASAAQGGLAGYFSRDPVISLWLASVAEENGAFALSVSNGELLPLAALDRLLVINKDLRRLYDTTASRHLESFDKANVPLMGWKWYLSQRDDDDD